MKSESAAALIIGAGYLGTRLAQRLLAAGHTVIATTRNPPHPVLTSSANCTVVRLDFAEPLAPHFAPIAQSVSAAVDVYCLLTPGALETEVVRNSLLDQLRYLPVRRAILTSSTAVYGNRSGGEVSAETMPSPSNPREQRLLEIEHAWLGLEDSHVMRLAGLYGPGRIIGERSLRANEVLTGSQADLLNLIHVDDAASLLIAAIERAATAQIELGSDGTPVSRGDYYRFVAEVLNLSPPRFDEQEFARGSKACVPATTMRRLNWRPQYMDYRVGVRACLADTK